MPKDSRRLNGIDHLLGEALESESVVLACATADASSAVFLRLCRYPGAATTWLWARVITPDINCHLNDNYLPCSDLPLKLEAAAVEYSTEDREILTLWREGDQARPSRCGARGRMVMYREGELAAGSSAIALSLQATFAPLRAHAGLLAGRTEIMGSAHVEIAAGAKRFSFDGLGQFHEQPQTAARFVTPFTYLSLWGEKLSAVALFTAAASGGYIFRDGHLARATSFAVSPPAPGRFIRMALEDGGAFDTAAHRVHAYRVPIYGRSWQGSFVTIEAGAGRVAGMINDWD
jgi:hypothetical protein